VSDLLIRKVPAATKAALKKKAKAAGKSMNDFVRETLVAAAKPSKKKAWAEADLIRAKILARVGHDLPDSTADIRQDRDNR
jgi:plasmid stability protein